ncbi:hypothetical protein V2J09_018618 [Rumex salicifolius]
MGRTQVPVAPLEEAKKEKKKNASKKENTEGKSEALKEEKKKKKVSKEEEKENADGKVEAVKEKKKGRKLKRSQRDAQALPHPYDSSDEEIHLGKQEQSGAESSEDEVHDGHVSDNGAGIASDEGHEAAEESDSSEDEVAPRNTVGDVPLEWYKDEEHIGYDITGKKIKKKERLDKLEKFLASADDSKDWRKIYDEYNDEEVELTKQETKLIHRFLEGKAPHSDFNPHEPYVDWFKWDDAIHPLSNAPEPKRRFIPSKWESKKIVRLVRAIREGRIKFDKPEEEPRFFNLWGDDSGTSEKTRGLTYIPPPKSKAPGHEESVNPSLEYIPTQEEINAYQLMDEEDRPKFIPKRYTSLRIVPAYENAVKEAMERCLDLYMCPRARRKRLNINPDALKPKLPNPKDFKPFPVVCALEFKGHKEAVVSISVDPSAQWIASGSSDGTVRIWSISDCRCIRIWDLGEAVQHVAWNPQKHLPILAVAVGSDVLILDTGRGNVEQKSKIDELLHAKVPSVSEDTASVVSWLQDDKHGGVKLSHFKTVSSIEWHRKGDYFSTVMPADILFLFCIMTIVDLYLRSSVLIHQLSKKVTQRIPFKLHGIPVSSTFHPSRSFFLVPTKKNIRVYDLVKQKLAKKLETGLREISSISIHPGGDNIIVGSREGKLCWFDMDLSSRPYKVLKCHPKDITSVAFHQSYPLFASCSDDCTAYVFHGMVYQDLNQNPLIVPLKILRGHSSSNGRGILDCKFHPTQPWLFTAGADAVIRMYDDSKQ